MSIIELIKGSSKNFILHIDGHTYYKHSTARGLTKWKCRNKRICYASATTHGTGRNVTLVRGGPAASLHKPACVPNYEAVEALKFVSKSKLSDKELQRHT